MMVKLWPARADSSTYLPLVGSWSSQSSISSRTSSPSPRSFNDEVSDDGYHKLRCLVSEHGSSTVYSPTTRRYAWIALLRILVPAVLLTALTGLAIFGLGTIVALRMGRIFWLPQYTLYDVAQVGWNRPLLATSTSPSVPWLPSAKGYTSTAFHDLDKSSVLTDSSHPNATAESVRSANDQHLLILSPLHNVEAVLPNFFRLLKKMEHPKYQTSIGFLLSDEEDNTGQMAIDWLKQQEEKGEYRKITLLRKDFRMLSPDRRGRHQDWVQTQRRALMAKARTLLLVNTLEPTVDWVLWLDADIANFPPSLFSDLLYHGNDGIPASDKIDGPLPDVIVPNVFYRPQGPGSAHSYDRSAWSETPASLAMKLALPADFVIHESDPSLETHCVHLADCWVRPNVSASFLDTSPFWPLDPTNPSHPTSDLYEPNSAAYIGRTMMLDAVGGVATLVRAQTHTYGAVFPSWAEEHQVETEGFGVIAKKLGARVVGLPNYLVWLQ